MKDIANKQDIPPTSMEREGVDVVMLKFLIEMSLGGRVGETQATPVG